MSNKGALRCYSCGSQSHHSLILNVEVESIGVFESNKFKPIAARCTTKDEIGFEGNRDGERRSEMKVKEMRNKM